MKLNRIMIAAPKSGSGKTTITCALLQALKNQGLQTVSYKCGPDYIDPMFHRKVIGISARNLDTFFTGEEETRRLFLKGRREGEFAVLEGVMGLYDGLGGIREEGSSYHLAGVTGTPIVLVVDAKGMGRSVIPLIAGFLAYDSEKLVRGVILNRMSETYYRTICPLIEKELNVSVLGYFPENKKLQIESRHLGLTLPHEQADIKIQLQTAAEKFQATVSVEKIVRIAESAEELPSGGIGSGQKHSGRECQASADVISFGRNHQVLAGNAVSGRKSGMRSEEADSHKSSTHLEACFHGDDFGDMRPTIAVAMDEAFCFYYEDNLLSLREQGAEISFFSPLHDEKLPEGCCGLLIGGGYPELYAEKLSANEKMLAAVRAAMESGMPVVAECGGFLYLHAEIVDKEGKPYAMAGALPGRCHYTGKLVRFGYIELGEEQSHFLPKGEKIKGHEFHYYDSTYNGRDCLAVKPMSGKSYPCVISDENHWLGFPHLYYPSNLSFCRSFVGKARRYKAEHSQAKKTARGQQKS